MRLGGGQEESDCGEISKARGQERSSSSLQCGEWFALAAATYIKGARFDKKIYITSQEEEGRGAQKKKEPPSAKTHNPFSHIRPENVCSGCLCCRGEESRGGWGGVVGGVSMYFITLRASALACTCVPDRASL